MENILKIDRSSLFEPVSFEDMGSGWFIEEQDKRSLAITSVDLETVSLKTMINLGEKCVHGEEKLRRLTEAGYIRLDARIFQTLWEKQFYIPEMWKSANAIFFDGTILSNPFGNRCVVYLYWNNGKWHWLYGWLESEWFINDYSACIVP